MSELPREWRNPDFDPYEDDVPHNLNSSSSWGYWDIDSPSHVEIDSQRWRTSVHVTAQDGTLFTFVCEREGSGEQGCWGFRNGEPLVINKPAVPEDPA